MHKVWDRRRTPVGADEITLNGEVVFLVPNRKNTVLADKVVDLMNRYERTREGIRSEAKVISMATKGGDDGAA